MSSPSTDRRFGSLGTLAIKAPCKAATTANITLSGEKTIDGIACVTNDRVLVKNQTDGTQNGIWLVDTGSWTRSPDWNNTYDVTSGTMVKVVSGSISGPFIYEVTNTGTITIGTTSITFSTSTLLASNLSLSGNLNFTGVGNRITGDFSNATVASRLFFQDKTTNNPTAVACIPNGTSPVSGFYVFNNSGLVNASYGGIVIDNSAFTITANAIGSGAFLPLSFATSGQQRLLIDTAGNLFQTTSVNSTNYYNVSNSNAGSGAIAAFYANSNAGSCVMQKISTAGGSWGQISNSGGTLYVGCADANQTILRTNNTDRLIVSVGGNVDQPTSVAGTLYNQVTNLNATAGAAAQFSVTTNAGSGQFIKYCAASGGALYAINGGGNAIYGTSDGNHAVIQTNNIQRLDIDPNGNILNISTGGLGYGTGSGGVVTQITSRTTPVTINKTNGAIVLFTKTTTAALSEVFTVNNSTVAATDLVSVVVKSASGHYQVQAENVTAGTFNIRIYTPAAQGSEAPVITFAVIKAVQA